MSKKKIFLDGVFSSNPILSLILGLCPVIIATQSIDNAIGMSMAVLLVLFFSNLIVSLIKNVIPSEIRIPVYIVIIASLVTCVDLLMQAFTPALSESLGEFIPLITVNCIILGRAEAFASKNKVSDSIIDALGMSAGFAMACLIIALFREFLGTSGLTISNPFNTAQSVGFVIAEGKYAIPLFVQAPGGFMMLGIVLGLFHLCLDKFNAAQVKKAQEKEALKSQEPVKEAK